MNAQLKQQIISAFQKTLISSKAAIEEGSALLTQLKSYQGTLLEIQDVALFMMEITDDANIKDQIRQAAAVQLKLIIQKRWKSVKTPPLTENQKNTIRQFLLTAFLRSHRNSKILPIYRVIVKEIIENDFKTWIPANDAILQIQKDPTTIPGCLYFLESIFHGAATLIEQQRVYMQNLIESIFPHLYEILKTNSSLEIVYLVSKIIWRAYKNSIKQKAMKESFKFMDVLKNIIEYHDPNLAALHSGKIQKFTMQFYYFHSKKWAHRTLWKFFQSHANSIFYETNEAFSNEWFKQFGKSFVQCLVKQIPIESIKKVKFFQIKALVAVSNFKFQLVQPHIETLLFTSLLPFIHLTQDQEKLAKEQPLEYLRAEQDPIQNFANTKSVATDLWVDLAGSTGQSRGKQQKKNTPPSTKFLMLSMEFLKKNLEQGNMIQKQMAMYLLCKMHRILKDVKPIQQAMPFLIKTYVLPHFANQIMLLRARAAELFSQYGHIEFQDQQILREAVKGIYTLMTNDNNPVVQLKAAYAFNCILRHKISIQMVKPYLKQILASYVKLLNQYQTETLVNSLEGIVAHFSEQIGQFAIQLVKHLTTIFMRYCGLVQNQTDENASNDVELAAGGCVDTIKRIIDSPLTLQTLKQLEPYLISVIETGMTKQGSDNCNDMLYLLASYINKIDVISKQMWFFYPCIFYLCTGLNQEIPNLEQYTETQNKVFDYLKQQQDDQLFDQGMPAIRSYIYKGINILTSENDFFGTNLFMLIFKTADKLYEGVPTDQIKASITALMIYILENVKQSEQLIPLMWQIIKRNMAENGYRYLRVINGQLACMCMYSSPQKFFGLVQQENSTEVVFDYIFHVDSIYLNQWQKQRVVLGLSKVLTLQNRSQKLISQLPRIMDQLKKHVNQIYTLRNQRINESDQETQSNNDEDNEDDYDGDEMFWQEPREQDFKTAIDEVDQVSYFQTCLKTFKDQQISVYNELMSKYSSDDLQHLQESIVKCKQQFVVRNKRIQQNLNELKRKGVAY